ncbi:hypothetical protein [Mycolicibacter sinensis]|uniref:hypothetical protein n=1 Tax=Mycolicibacter sinensis (strain JDM601) TaxID=875328 RepID=UPI0007E92DA4|nr:hypothetical protein [Mycolicibacter sinensis]OBH17954.1 hypothetical protein A5694_02155 [Mycolicibacter sinensis]
MGLDAYVSCNCYREGLTTEPPMPRSRLKIDERGDVVPIHFSHDDDDDTDDDIDMWDELMNWKETACAHPSMQLAGELMGNIMSIAWLRSVAAGLPADRFGNLAEILCGLSGMMDSYQPASDVRRASPELDALLRQDYVGLTRIICADGDWVVDNQVDRGAVDYASFHSLDYGAGYNAPWPDLVELGIEAYEFVVRTRAEQPRELLRARILRQEWDAGNVEYHEHGRRRQVSLVTFTNVQNGESVRVRSFGISSVAVSDDAAGHGGLPNGDERRRYPSFLFISERKLMLAECWWQLAALKRLFDASVASGNPVVWC